MEKLVIKLKQSFGIGKYLLVAFCICCSFLTYSDTVNATTCKHLYQEISRLYVDEDCYAKMYDSITKCKECKAIIAITTIYDYFPAPRHTFSGVKSIGCNGQTHTYQYYCSDCGASGSTFKRSCNGNCILPS